MTSLKTVKFSAQLIKFPQLENTDWKLLLILKRNRRYRRQGHCQPALHIKPFVLKSSKVTRREAQAQF